METKNVKIGFFPLHSFSRPGGVKAHVLGLQKELKRRGIKSRIVVPRRSPFERSTPDIKYFGTSFPIFFNGSQSDFTICLTPGSITKFLKKEGFDILHFHNFGVHSWQILEKSRVMNILTFHSNINFETNKFFKAFPFIANIFKESVKKKIDGIIGVAPFNLEPFKKFGFRGPMTVIPNGIDLEGFNPNAPKIKRYLDDKINLLFLGRIEERKGLIYLLLAYRLLQESFKNLRLIVVGEGDLKKDCEDWVKKHRLKNVIFEGEVKESQTLSYYATSDIFISPAIFGESFGIVLLEAMAMGKPIVAFANEGYKRVLVGRGREFLVTPKNWRALAGKIKILVKNKKKRDDLGEWGKKEVQKYSWPRIAEQVLSFYEKVMKTKR